MKKKMEVENLVRLSLYAHVGAYSYPGYNARNQYFYSFKNTQTFLGNYSVL
jgi:hypothetical protein